MNTNAYIRPLLRWWRLIVILTMLALVASAVSTLFQPKLYVSKTTLVIGSTILDPNPDSGQIYIAQQLAQIYADMALREPIQQATMDALGIDWLPMYQSKVVPNTQMVEVSVTDTNPERAQIIATELAAQLIKQSPAVSGTETGTRQEFISQQLSSLQIQIEETENKIEELQQSLVGLNSASQIANVEDEINEQSQKLNTLRQNYANFLANSQQGALNILSVVEPANLPERPTGTNRFIVILLAGMVGFSLGAGAAYLIEYLDQTVKTTSDIERIFGLPVIGYISQIVEENGSKGTYVAQSPDSVLAENFRLLWSNIEFYRISNPVKTILVTSPSQGNGKTTLASNLALSIAQDDHQVILVDADLRRSAVHKNLDMAKAPGLCDVLMNKTDLQNVIRPWKGDEMLKVITAGNQPANITEVIGSNKIARILSKLKDEHELIIIDAPPLVIADSYNLASKVDGIVIVMEPGLTTDEQARTMKEQLTRANAKIIGFVFNKVSEESVHSYGDYQYRSLYSPKYYADYVTKSVENPTTTSRSEKLTDFLEHGKVPSEMESAIAAIKTRPRGLLGRNTRSRRNGKS